MDLLGALLFCEGNFKKTLSKELELINWIMHVQFQAILEEFVQGFVAP